MKIKTERLILREWKDKDLLYLFDSLNNLNVSKWLLVVPFPFTLDDAQEMILRYQKQSKAKPRENYSLSIELEEEKKAIGGIGLFRVDRYQGKASVMYWLNEKNWRKGFGSEALEAVLDFAFNTLDLRRIDAGVYPGNPSSGKLLEKFGFKVEGIKSQGCRCKATGEIVDENLYALLRENYNGERK